MSTKALAVGKDRTRKGPVPTLMPEDCPVWRALTVYWAVAEGAETLADKGHCHLRACDIAREALYSALADETQLLSEYAAIEAAEMLQSRMGPDHQDILSEIMSRHILQAHAAKTLNS